MVDVTAYIRELLFSHDCVILPSFGGFIANYTPARIDSTTNTFTPPVKAISFNRNLNNNDGLLIARISADRGIGYADSRRLVEEFADDLRRRLQKGERVNLDLIGFLQNNNEGNAQFEPDRNSNFLLDSYGLGSFVREPVAGYDVNARILKRRDHSSAPYISRKMAWRAAVAVPFIAAMIFVPLKTDLFRSSASMNPLARAEIEETTRPVTEMALPVITPAEAGLPAEIQEEVQETALAEAVIETPFHLVTGSFMTEENALNQKASLKSRGYDAVINRASNGYYRVYASSFSSYAEAMVSREALETDFPGTWILKK